VGPEIIGVGVEPKFLERSSSMRVPVEASTPLLGLLAALLLQSLFGSLVPQPVRYSFRTTFAAFLLFLKRLAHPFRQVATLKRLFYLVRLKHKSLFPKKIDRPRSGCGPAPQAVM